MGHALTISVTAVLAVGGADNSNDSVTARFVEHVKASQSYATSVKEFLDEQWAERKEDDDADAFLLEALALVSEDFRAGLDAFRQDRHTDCVKIMEGLADDEDPFASANAAVFVVRALVAADDLVEAEQHIARLLALPARLTDYTHASAEMHYLRAYCQLGNLKYADAMASFGEFLDRFPDAPQRLRMTATQMLAELRQHILGGIGEVTDLMDYSARRLASADSATHVQERQQAAVDILDTLIEEAEEREKNSDGGGGGNSSRNQQQQPNPGNQPMPDSRLPDGPTSRGGALRDRVARPGEAWGAMREADRERIIQHLKDRFPDRYRQLVEQYYQQLAEQP